MNSHPNIIGLYGYFWDDVNVYIIMEYGPYGDLKKMLDREGSFSEKEAASCVGRAKAVRFRLGGAHRNGAHDDLWHAGLHSPRDRRGSGLHRKRTPFHFASFVGGYMVAGHSHL